jgi:molybdopterin-guanine dinucleotide biosynthesis protein A
MPNIMPAPLAWLAARLRENPAAAAVMVEQPELPNRVEPLPAAFRNRVAQTLVRAQLRDRQLALHRLAENSQVVVVPASSDWPSDF